MKKNISWINHLKFICIIGVFFVHCNQYYGYDAKIVNIFIHPFYVNAFFFISGYLLFRKQLSEEYLGIQTGYIRKEVKTLLQNILFRLVIPTVLFSIIEFIPSHLLRGYEFDIGRFLYKTIGGCTYWFTAALTVAELIIVGLFLTRKKNIWFYFLGCILFYSIGQFIVTNEISLLSEFPSFPWQYKEGLLALIFLVCGGIYWRYEAIILKYMNNWVVLCMVLAYVTCLAVWPSYFHTLIAWLDLNTAGIGLSLMVTVALIELSKKIPAQNTLNYIGQNTIGMYFMSGALPIVLSMMVHCVMPKTTLAGFAIVFLGSMFIAYVAMRLMKKYIPWVFDLRLLWNKAR